MSQEKRNANAMFNLTRCGLLAAMAVILYYIEIPVVAFYKLDLSTMPAILAGFAMGPVQGAAVVIVKNLVHMLGTSTACVGEMADILMSCAFVIPASLLYRRNKTRKGALHAMLAGGAAMTVAGVLVNYFILIPAYQVLMNLPLEVIIGMGQKVLSFVDSTLKLVIFITAPFNLLKAAVLSGTTYLLYKRVSPLLHQRGGR
ncbi:MAG: ECF transporter S component [Clostridiales bacterium]|nr:ECF transporter S component [Clostridiales bacterium]MDY3762942.1 ECF transporter S component [Candidatus Ventricola sp.]MCI6587885.1 ECF transporter S component [Clostridiales bacterium]MCI7705033.1 ECF transporter S component [Clostridiales bacterium]MDY3831893.1 ECF transporter S component [Candidatus Ventricola sp.]